MIARWLINRIDLRQAVDFGMLVAMLGFLPGGLAAAGWLTENAVLWWAALAGALFGWLVGRLIHRWDLASVAILVGGVLFIGLFQSKALPPVGLAASELASLARWAGSETGRSAEELIQRVTPGETEPESEQEQEPEPIEPVLPAPLPSMPEWTAARDRLLIYAWNLQADWPPLVRPHRRGGQILLGSLIGMLVWLSTSLAVWLLRKYRTVWVAFVPVFGLLAASLYFTMDGWAYLILSLSAGMVLASTRSLGRLEDQWKGSLPSGIELEWWAWTGSLVLGVGVAMGLTIWVTSPEFADRVNELLHPSEEAESSTAIASDDAVDRAHTGTWPRQHILGFNPALAESPVMTVATPERGEARLYWQYTSYDEYTGYGWFRNSTQQPRSDAEPLWPEPDDLPDHAVLLRQDFRLEFDTVQIYAAGRPVRLSGGAGDVWYEPTGTNVIAVDGVFQQYAYQVVSWISSATPEDLRAAGEDYPDWVLYSYLALPDELPPRVSQLAEDLTADADNPYDRALALQNYLRGYEYTLDIPPPPENRDVVDYFLFDLERGYCDYYASSMVVMARSIGIPARLAVGYASGEYDLEEQVYRVVRADAHSWVEIYFPGYGWVPFEPTAALPVPQHGQIGDLIDTPAEEADEAVLDAFEASQQSEVVRVFRRVWPWLLVSIPVALAAAVGIGELVRKWREVRLRKCPPDQIVETLYVRLLRWGERLDVPVSAAMTPHEFSARLGRELVSRADEARNWNIDWGEHQVRAGAAAAAVVELYAEGLYSPRQVTVEQAGQAVDGWVGLQRQLWAFWLLGRVLRLGRVLAPDNKLRSLFRKRPVKASS